MTNSNDKPKLTVIDGAPDPSLRPEPLQSADPKPQSARSAAAPSPEPKIDPNARWVIDPDTTHPSVTPGAPPPEQQPAKPFIKATETAEPAKSTGSTVRTVAADDDDDDDWQRRPISRPPPAESVSSPDPGGNKPCHYILAIGKKGSGKSTFQSHMYRYLTTSGEFIVEPDIDLARNAPQYQRVLAEWQEQWDRGRFPRGTRRGSLTDIRHDVRSNLGHPKINFGFLEIAGEDFEELTKLADGPPRLLPSIDKFLNNPNVKICFMFVCNGADVKGSDYLFKQFLDYLKIHVDKKYESNSSVALVLADPEMCRQRLSLDKNYTDSKLDIEKFVRTYVPQTASWLNDWKHRAMIAPFSVGRVAERTKSDGSKVSYIEEPAFDDAKVIFKWVYKQFTNKDLDEKLTLAERVGLWLDSIASWGGQK